MEGFKREQNIETLKIVVWHVLEYDHSQVEDHSYGQFHEGDTYVIRWQYMIVNAGKSILDISNVDILSILLFLKIQS